MRQSTVSFRETRSVTDVLNATFLFIRQNIQVFGKMLLLIILPVTGFFVIGATVLASSVESLFNVDPSQAMDAGALGSILVGFGLFGLLAAVATLAVYTGALAIIRLYDQRGAGNFEVEDVWAVLKQEILGFFLLGVMMALITMVPIILVVWIPCLNVIAGIAWYLYVSGTFGLSYAVYMIEDRSIMASIRRSKDLVEGYFWPTVGIFLLTTIIVGILGVVAQLPFQIIGFADGFLTAGGEMSSTSVIFFALSYLVSFLVGIFLGCVPQVAMTFQYASLVERKESVGLQRRVENIGNDVNAGSEPATDPFEEPASNEDTDTTKDDWGRPGTPESGSPQPGGASETGDEIDPADRIRGEDESDEDRWGRPPSGREPDEEADDRWRPSDRS